MEEKGVQGGENPIMDEDIRGAFAQRAFHVRASTVHVGGKCLQG